MATALRVVKTESKPKRERISVIEVRPKEEWFVRTKTFRGKTVWYIRFEVTGMHPRLFGPFPSKRQGLLFLDDAIGELLGGLIEAENRCEKRMVKEECQKVWLPIIEYPLLTQRHSITKKGR